MGSGGFLPPTYLFASLAGMVLLQYFLPGYQLISYPWNTAGIIPLALGMAINISADRAFKNYGTTVKPYEVSKALITTGIYSYTRNPMYLGMVMILTGAAFLLGAISTFIIIPIFTIVIDRVFIDAEEKMLEERFGSKWKQYKADVRRWI